jgi:hypothetical protein
VLLQSLVGQTVERVLGPSKGNFPSFIRVEFLENGRGELILFRLRKAGRRLERLPSMPRSWLNLHPQIVTTADRLTPHRRV